MTDEKLQKLIAGAIFDFAGYLTTRDNDIPVGSHSDAAPMVGLIQEWAKTRNLSLADAAVEHWSEQTKDSKDIKIGRLEKKIRKLIQQRDHYKQKHEYYAKVISMQPHLERRWEGFEAARKERERVKGLEARIKEQEQLIRMLTKEEMDK